MINFGIGNFVAFVSIGVIVCCNYGCKSREGDTRNIAKARDVAIQETDIPLPMSATNIFFFEKVGGMQCLTRLMRFDVATNELDSAVSSIIAHNNKIMLRSLVYKKRAVAEDACYSDDKSLGLSWWNVGEIAHGYNISENAGYAVHLWVDQDKNRIYLFQSD